MRLDPLKYLGKVRLIGYGIVDGKPAIEFQVGDKVLFNYGFREEVIDKRIKGNWVYLTLRTEKGTVNTIRKRKDTLLAIG